MIWVCMTGIALGRSSLEQVLSLWEEDKHVCENLPHPHSNAPVGEQRQSLPHAWGWQQRQKRMRKMPEKERKRRETSLVRAPGRLLK